MSGLVPADRAGIMQLVLGMEESGAMTLTTLALPPEIEFERYESVGAMLGQMKRSSSWWIGDWILFGEGLYGERQAQAALATGLEETTLTGYARVCAQVAPTRRQASLGFGAHQLVAPMEPKAQNYWLRKAVEKGWTTAELRDAIRVAEEKKNPRLPGGEGEPGPKPGSVEEVALAVFRSASPAEDGQNWLVPNESMARLRGALGLEE